MFDHVAVGDETPDGVRRDAAAELSRRLTGRPERLTVLAFAATRHGTFSLCDAVAATGLPADAVRAELTVTERRGLLTSVTVGERADDIVYGLSRQGRWEDLRGVLARLDQTTLDDLVGTTAD